MRAALKAVMNKHGIFNEQESIIDNIIETASQQGYVHLDSIKLDEEAIVLCLSRALNELKQSNPIVIEG